MSEHRNAIFGAFTVSDDYLPVRRVYIFNPKSEAFFLPEAGSIEEVSHQTVLAVQRIQNRMDILSVEYHGETPRPVGSRET